MRKEDRESLRKEIVERSNKDNKFYEFGKELVYRCPNCGKHTRKCVWLRHTVTGDNCMHCNNHNRLWILDDKLELVMCVGEIAMENISGQKSLNVFG